MTEKDETNAVRLARAVLRALDVSQEEDRKMALRKVRLFAQEIVDKVSDRHGD